ncbi:MAG: isocitrate lyase/phosphoenolpyruvate mutase family protein, partial [Nannocystaceae bacterium]|nr:isocitrate lyase/phosphoenolpyruvate mutase family protein [Nannocystaceae bacterium]
MTMTTAMTMTMTTTQSPSDPRPPSSRSGSAGLLKLLATSERPLRLLQAHDGLSARIASEAGAGGDVPGKRFHGLWISSLADSASRAQPDEETIDLGDRISALSWMLDATDLPVVFDADTGGQPHQASLTARRL